jgi:cytochrome c-type biogenesis protein CcmH
MKVILQIFLIISCLNSYAFAPEERLADELQEQRARNLFLEVRCLVCEGQVIESSDTAFSFEMRKLIRNKILAGKNDEEIRQDLIDEFGEDILISEINGKNKILFILPVLFAIIMLILAIINLTQIRH